MILPMAPRKTVKKPSTKNAKKDPTLGEDTVQESPQKSSVKRLRVSKTFIIFGVLILLLAGALYFGRSYLIVATVNGEPITRLALINELEKRAGKQILDDIVIKTLILQEAKKKNVSVSKKEIDDEVKKTEDFLKKNGQKLEDLLVFRGLTYDQFIERIKFQLLSSKIVGDKDVEVTDKEVSEYIEKNKELLPDTNQSDSSSRNEVKQQIKQQKLNEKIQKWMTDLQGKAKIQYLMKF